LLARVPLGPRPWLHRLPERVNDFETAGFGI